MICMGCGAEICTHTKEECKDKELSIGPEFRELPVPRTAEEIDDAIRRREENV